MITGTASEATLTALLTARSQAVTAFREQHEGADIDRQQVGWSKRNATASSFIRGSLMSCLDEQNIHTSFLCVRLNLIQ